MKKQPAKSIGREISLFGTRLVVVMLLSSALIFAVNGWLSTRKALGRRLLTLCEMISANSEAALRFNDSAAAKETLDSLRSQADIEQAVLFVSGGGVLASYTRSGTALEVPLKLVHFPRAIFGSKTAEVFFPIGSDPQARLGILYVRSDLNSFYEALQEQAFVLFGLLVCAVILAWLVGRPLQRRIAQQIFEIAQIAKTVSANRDYGIRVAPSVYSEIHDLGESMNQMLRAVQERDRRLTNKRELLEQSNRELRDFAHIASHDLQEPLRKLQTFASRLQQKHEQELSAGAQQYIGRIQTTAGRMRSLIEDLLALSRVMASERSFEDVDLSQIVHEVLEQMEELIKEKGAEIKRGELPKVQADRTQMYSLFQNLIGNSLKYSRDRCRPEIRIEGRRLPERDDEIWEICIKDNGIGFEDRYAQQIFRPFQRLHTREEYPGTGIGLAICAKVVQRHHGVIKAAGVPGEGATFTFTLPAKQRAQNFNNRGHSHDYHFAC